MSRHARSPQYTVEAFREIAAFLPALEAPDFQFVDAVSGSKPTADGFRFPAFHYDAQVLKLVRTLEQYGWVYSDDTFRWPEWKATPEAIRLRDDPEFLAQATPQQLAKLTTIFVRQERFCDGARLTYWETGLLTATLRRVATLATEYQGQTP